MGRLFIQNLGDDLTDKYQCAKCGCDIAMHSDMTWDGLMPNNKPAYLLSKSINTDNCGEVRKEKLATGQYTIQDVQCRQCFQKLGWQYIDASNQEFQYKIGSLLLCQELLKRNLGLVERKPREQVRMQTIFEWRREPLRGQPQVAAIRTRLIQEM